MKLIIALCGILLFCAISVQSENLEVSTGEINKFEEAPENDEEVESNWFELQHETIQQQADQPTSGEQFIAIRIGTAGSKDQINSNLEGLVRIATDFLPKTYTFINVVSATREVVAGIKYELLVNALDENRSEVLCEIRILEQPWIITNKNEKLRTLLYSNCSTDEANSSETKSDVTQLSINPIFNNEEQVMTDERLKVMESLIITTDNKTPNPHQQILTQQSENIVSHNREDEDALTVVTLSKGTSSFLDDFFSFGKTEKKPIQGSSNENDVIAKLEAPTRTEATADHVQTENAFYHVGLKANGETPSASNTEISTQITAVQVNNVKDQLNGDVSQSFCAQSQQTENTRVADVIGETRNIANMDNMNENVERPKRASMDDNDLMLMERRLFSKLLKAALARLDRYDEDDKKRVILKVLKSEVFENVYKFEVKIADTKCSESSNSAENCLSHIIDESIKLCRFEIEHLGNDDIKLKKSECAPDTRVKRQLGGARPVSESEQQQVVEFINGALENGDKPGFSLTRVIKATKQTVSGHLYKVEAEFSVDGSTKVCNIKIWDRPWLGTSAREVTFDCDPPARRKRQLGEIHIVGGVSTIQNSAVEPLLNEVLLEGDYRSYRIIQTTHQLATGSLYRIKAEFDVDQSIKNCSVQIWDRPWLGKAAREVEFTCDSDVARVKRSNPPKPKIIKGGITPLPDSEKSNVENLLNEVLVGSDYQSHRLVRLIEASRQVVAGRLYRIKGEFEVEGARKICNVKIWVKVAGEGNEITEFNCDVSNTRSKRHIPGGITHISELDKAGVESLLNEVLSDGDYQSYRLIRIIKFLDTGSLYQIKALFSVEQLTKVCNVKISYRLKLGKSHRLIEFHCDGSSREKRQIPGGISPTSEIDKPKIEGLLNEVLAEGDYQSYRLIRIIESTIQIVSGTIYKIKAEFMVEKSSKICNVKIWDRPWLGKSAREVEFKCDELSRRKRQIRGGFKSIKVREKEIDNDFLKYVQNILKDILQSCDYQSYKLIRVIDLTSEVINGFIYRIKAEFSVNDLTKICNIKIWEKESSQGREVQEFICHDRNKTRIGGKSIHDEEQEPRLEYILDEDFIRRDISNGTLNQEEIELGYLIKTALTSTAYKAYRLVRIIEFTKENVAGVLYKIKAEFTINGIEHICDVKLWHKSSGREKGIEELKCNQKSRILRSFNPTPEEDKPKVENLLREVLAYDDYQSYTLIKILQSWQQIEVGINYKVRVEVKVEGELKICDIKILNMFTKHGKHAVQSVCQNIGEAKAGGIIPVLNDGTAYIESIVNGALLQGNYQSYKLVKIIEATKQIVAGVLYRIKAQFLVNGTDKICNLKIWDKISNQRREVQEFICEESSPPVQGEISVTTEVENSAIENILNSLLLGSGDFQSYRLIRIIESTKQIAAGVIYRIKAEFVVDGVQKICSLKIWDKISNKGTEIQEFICVKPSTSLAGSITVTSRDEKYVVENILKGVLSTGDYQSYRLVRIIESSKQIVAGILYRIKAEFAVNGIQKICNVKIWDKVSNQGREIQEFICEASTIDETSILPGSHANGATSTTQAHTIPVLGGISATLEDEKFVIENILRGVLSTGDYQSYRLVRIIESSKQIVAGILYRIKAEFAVDGIHKICNVKILEKVSNQGREVQEFICEASTIDETLILPGSHANGATSTTQAHTTQVLGGISATSEDEKSVIENILKGVLSTGDYQSYRLVRIIESSKQIVAGILYRIKAEFAVNGIQKICNVKILEKVSNQGREVQEFICEASTINETSILPGSHATGGATSTTQAQTTQVLGGISATAEDKKLVIENILKGVLSTGDYQSYRLVRIIESSKQIVAGILYRIKAEFAVDGVQKICNVKIWDKVSNQGREVQEFICEASTINETSILPGSHANGATSTTQAQTTQVLGGISATSEDDKSVIENILKGVLSSGDYQSYRLVRIIESSKQIVASILYRIKAEFAVDGVQKICNVKIWDKVSNQDREVQEFICEASTINETSILPGSHANGATSTTQAQTTQVLGGISATSEDDKSVIENILKGVLSSGDYQSYRLVRIIELSKQIVAGTLYRIKAEFAVDGIQKICNVKIWDKVSNQGREVREFICEASTINETSILPGSHANGATSTTQAQTTQVLGGISATSEDDKSVIENILKSVLSTGDYQSYRLVRIIETSKQIVAGILYRIKAEFAVDGTQKICNLKIWDKVSNQGREVQEFICEASTINETSILPGSHANGATSTTQAQTTQVLGGISATSEDDKSVIENILKGVLSTGNYQSYRLVRIIESSKQIVAGILYRIKAEFAVDGIHKICNVKILEKVSNQGREVQEFICEASTIDETLILPGSHANGATSTTQAHTTQVLGGISATSEDEKSVIENILKGVLSTGDYQSYRLVRIIESSKQIVAGILYRIKAEFAVNGIQKICNVKILEKVSNQGREVQEFICEASTINETSILPGSHATGGATSTTQAQTTQVLGGISATSEDEKLVIENILKGVLSTGDYQSYRLVRIIESSKQIVAGILYRIKAEFAVDGVQKICNVKIWDKVSNQGREVQEFICEASTINETSILPGSHANGATSTTQAQTTQVLGGISATSEDDKSVIENILKGVLSSGDYQSYRLVRIIESSKQIVAGILYRIKAEFAVDGIQKICNVKIWDKVSNQDREVQEFICEESTINETSILPGSHANGATSTTQAQTTQVLGGISATSEDDKSVIENILKGVLSSGDYQSYRLVRIIELSKQIVAGTLYRIKAEFAVDGIQKICNVKIWDKVSNQGREVQEFICEASTINETSILPGSHANGATSTTQAQTTQVLGGISATSEDDKSVIENILKGVLSTGDYQSYRLVRIIESSKQIVAGILYRIKAEFAVDGTQKICNLKIWDKVSNQGREVQEFICEASTINETSILPGSHATGATSTTQAQTTQVLGGISATSEDEKLVIENILKGVLSSGDYQSYRLVRIIESSKQIVAGILYRIKAEFAVDGIQKICNVKILEKVSNQGREVREFICEASTINETSILPGSHANGATSTTQAQTTQVLGGISATSEDDKSVTENILKSVLSTGDYQSYRLVRIIESSKQIIAGILYRIKAEFAVDGIQKICNVKIWDKVSNQGREVQEFICEASTINETLILPGSHANGATSTTQAQTTQVLGGISATSEDEKLVIENILKGVLSSGDYQSYRLVRIIESSKQIVAGILYRIKAEFAVDGIQKICNVKIWDKVPNQGREVQEFICEASTINETSILPGSHANSATSTTQVQTTEVLGGISATSEDDKSVIENILKGVLSTGDYQSYRLVRIIESSKQIVAGILYRIKAEFAVDGIQKICNVKIWDKVSNQGREVQEFICEASTINETSILPGSHANGATSTTQAQTTQVLGGISATSEDDKSVIQNILKSVLSTGDYQSYRLVRIIESSKQIVAGILYRIKAEFAVDGTQKICNLKIWDKVSNQGREVQEFICEASTINETSILPGSHATGAISTTQAQTTQVLAGISATAEDEKLVIENILKGVLSSGDYQSYRLVRIIESSKQIVAGILYRIKAEFAVDGIQKICNVKILEKVSNQGIEVQEFICEAFTINETSILPGSHANGATSTTQAQTTQVLGGISATSKDDKSVIENILKGVLSTGDYQSYRLVRIIESSKQIVAGILYRIKAEFAVDGIQKICNVKIWDKVSNQGREVREFICEASTINETSILPGSYANGATSTTQAQTTQVLGGISATSEDDKSVIENILKSVLSTGDYQSYRLVRIIESSKQIVAGILYRIKAEFAVDGTQKICNLKIWDKVSNQGREVQEFICEASTINETSILPGSHANGATSTTQAQTTQVLGGISATSEDDKSVIQNILKSVLSSGDYQSYRLVRIIESSKQIVAGILYRIKAEFAVDGTQKICNLKIWDKVSNQGREVQEFICEASTINETSILPGSHATGATSTTQAQTTQVLGGISATSEDDKSVIENILKDVLSSGDYQSYRLVRIIESSKQIVAGILYRIKAEFAVDGIQKICNVKIWDKVPNQGREVQEFICEASTINETSILPGSHANSATSTTQVQTTEVLGGISATSEDDKSVIENILKGVLSTGDYQSYRLVRIIESSKQIVAGILYRIKAEFAVDGIQKICNVKIWDKVSNQGREVQEFICEASTINETSILPGSHANGATSTTQAQTTQVLGGISATSEDDKSVIQNILKSVLSTGDYQSYRLVRIIESSKQIVAGILYRIKAEFAVDGTQKICNLKIWDKVSSQGREVQEFICEASTINETSILPGSHATGAISTTQAQTTQVLGGISATAEDEKLVIENILKGVLSSGDYQSYRLVRIIESSKQIVAGILYRIKAEFAVDGIQKICNVKILEKVSNQGIEVQEFICEAFTINETSILPGSHANGATSTTQAQTTQVLGGIRATSEDDKSVIENILKDVLSSGDYQSYRLVRIIESSKQIVAGILYRIKAEFAVDGIQKICNVKIWDKVPNQGREVQEFICEASTINETSILPGSHANSATSTTQVQTTEVLGGISATSEDDKSVIENILKGVLSTGDYQSYRLVRIIESSKQIVAGILYRIKAEFAVDGTQKICNLKIWDKVSNQGREVQEFICEASTINETSILPGSHANGATSTTQAQTTQVLGGISATSEDDKSVIQNILKSVLSSGDYQSYRLVRIIESSKQIVAGILYRIKAEFAVDGTQKICNLKIWDKVSNQGREVQEFICEASTINETSILPGSHATGAISTTQAQTTQVLGGISATAEDEKLVIENILKGVLSSGDYQSYRLVRIIESSKQIVAGIVYRIKAEFAVDGIQKICNMKIWDKVSNQGREVQEFICEAFTINETSFLPGSHANGATSTTQAQTTQVLGGISATSEDDKSVIENILKDVLSSGDYQSYRLVRIIESSKQIVAGILYRIKAEFAVDGIQKICNVKIWDKVSNQGREVQEFICDSSTINETSILPGSHANGATSTTQAQTTQVLGGISATSEDDKSVIQNILKSVLSSGDYQSYRLVRIIESSKQIVAGILYRIKAEFAVDGTQKICNLKIWDKVSNQGREVQEFICEASTINETSILPGSHATGAISTTQAQTTQVLGGISATAEDEKLVIENILKGVLSSGDYQSYRLVRIIESSKQIVAGILYRIKAEFAVDGIQKICNMKILEKVSNQGIEVQEFICEAFTINETSFLPGSHANGATSTTQAQTTQVLGGISATSEDDKSVIENILKDVLSSGDYQSYRLVRIIESSKQIVAGILYRIKAEFAVDGIQKICNVKIWDKVSNQGREVQEFICDSSTINETSILPGSHANGATSTTQAQTTPVLGGISATSEDEKLVIENILKGVLSSGDYQSYRLVRIIESSKQIVAGILYRIKAEFAVGGTQKICNVKIWDKVSNQGREVQEFICEASTINETSILPGSHATGATSTTQAQTTQVLGGISATSEDEKLVIENILKGVLSSGDYQSYRLVRIIGLSKQIVAGILYRIKAEFAVDGIQKICNVKIWDKVSNQGREVQEFICEASTINETSILPGSHATGATSTTQAQTTQVLGGISATSEDDKSVIENILKGVLSSGDYQSYRLVRIIESSKQIVAGILYRIKAEFAVDGIQKICNVKIWDKVSNEGREVQEFICENPTFSVFAGLDAIDVSANSEAFIKPQTGVSTSENDKLVIAKLLNGILTGSDYQSYRLVRILESTKQLDESIMYQIKAEFLIGGFSHICYVTISDMSFLQGKIQHKFNCRRTVPLLNGFNLNNLYDKFIVDQDIAGGISPSSVGDKFKVESLLNEVLSHGDYQSYRLVKIIESTTQIVSGILYKIKAEFNVDGLSNICNVKIWDRPWLGKSERQVEFNCEEMFRHKLQVPGEMSTITDRTKIENILNEVLVGDYSSYRLVRIIESSSQIVSGTLYKIKAEFSVDRSTKVCNVKIWDRPWLGNKSGRQVEFICESSRRKRQIPGGNNNTSDTVKVKLELLLNKALAEGNYQSYRLLKIIKTTDTGSLFRIKAEFDLDGAEKFCDITIWKTPTNEDNKVTQFSCVRKRAIKRRSSDSSSSSSSDSSEYSERSNKNKIRNVLNDVLSHDDYESYRLVRIIQGSRQPLTSGTLYYIEAIFLIDGDQRQCIVNINERTKSNRKVYFNCPQPTLELSNTIRGGFTVVPISERSYIQNLVTEVLSAGEYQTYRVIRIIEASSQIVSGVNYRIKAEFAVEDVQKTCVIIIWVKLSNVEKEVTEFTCEEPQEQQHTTFLWRKVREVQDRTEGRITKVSEFDKSYVESILRDELLTGGYHSYRLVRIIEATEQIVSGSLFNIIAEFIIDGNTRNCSIKIWDQPWLGKAGRNVEFKSCDGDALVRAKRDLSARGAPRPLPENEYANIEKMLNSALAEGDRQNYRLTRILHATKQLTSGWTYKIRGAFEVEGVIKRCNIKIWNRPWLRNANTIESFKCDEHDEHTIRLNHDEKIKRTLDSYLHGNFTDNKVFEIYEKLYNKNYQTTLARNIRLRIFKTNLRKIRNLNQYELGTATYGITEFADLTSTEYRMRTGLVRRTTPSNHISNPIAEIPNIVIPREFDWRTRGVISEVKNQGSCGSCWAFSVIGNIEGLHAIKTGVLEEYSEQELVDCDTIDSGCNGGLPDDAYKAIEQLGGLETEKDYPYTARRDHCAFNQTKVKTQIKGAVDLPKNETAIAQWLLQNGPVSIGINANAMQFYRGGVSHPWHVLCNKADLDHGVLIVGFGVHEYPKFNKTLPYWIIKNSWGPRWGEQGYYRVFRGDNTCGVSEMVSSAVLE